ncbi:GTP cyclohydrolase I FolE [Aliivibrio fischeri]|uniref:GTP cyclohydrolase I FolE n=1 Tax=Aliivibrio fischeri TaxID=668 RepID=UPI0007C47953|nr:GTP cyclohydrolase I FolE [Aliivibrio fischeri]
MNEFTSEALIVKKILQDNEVETPMITDIQSLDKKYQIIISAIKDIMQALSLDLTDDSLQKTPVRVASMFIDEVFSGLDYSNFPKITTIDNKMSIEEEIIIKDISFTSICEHHLIVFDGIATVGYIPKNKVIGLSKINRLVRFFSQRPQVQERLTTQIFFALQALLGVEDVYVKLNATHFCVKSRGIMDSTSSTTTVKSGGKFKNRGHLTLL